MISSPCSVTVGLCTSVEMTLLYKPICSTGRYVRHTRWMSVWDLRAIRDRFLNSPVHKLNVNYQNEAETNTQKWEGGRNLMFMSLSKHTACENENLPLVRAQKGIWSWLHHSLTAGSLLFLSQLHQSSLSAVSVHPPLPLSITASTTFVTFLLHFLCGFSLPRSQ